MSGSDSETFTALPPELAAPTNSVAPFRFPWPPAELDHPLPAAAEAWRWSVFQPASFFRAMPDRGYASALLYYLPVGILAGGLTLFWSNALDLAGVSTWLESAGETADVSPASRLIDFLLSPIWLTALLFIGAAVIHGSLKLIAATPRPLVATTRVLAFSCGPSLFGIVPLIGPLAGGIWSLVLVVIGLREVHATTTARAIAALLIPIAILFTLLMVLGLLFALVLLAAGLDALA